MVRDDRSPSSSGTSYSGGSSGAPDGRVEESVEEYVHEGCSEGSRNSPFNPDSSGGKADETLLGEFVAVLRLVEGRFFFCDLSVFAFRKPEVHQSSRSSAMELAFELLELIMEGVAEWIDRSFAIRSLRSPTFSAPGSVQDRSAENIM